MDEGWNDEVALRTEALKCRVCGGANPYVCRCARAAWFAEQERRKRPKPQTLDQQWESHCALTCTPNTEKCDVCNTGEWKSFCACAKKKWIEWKEAHVEGYGY